MAHVVAPNSYGPAGGYDIFTSMVAEAMFVFGFIVAATLGCTAGSVDLTEGMFRHLVVTGRSRLALYLARIPAGLAIIVPLVAVGFTVVCAVCVFAAPTQFSFNNVKRAHRPVQARPGFMGSRPCRRGHLQLRLQHWSELRPPPSSEQRSLWGWQRAVRQDRTRCSHIAFGLLGSGRRCGEANCQLELLRLLGPVLSPSISLMIQSGRWIELYAATGLLVGLGLASLMGQRTVPVILLIVLEVVLTPLLSQTPINHLVNLQRSLLGPAATHFEPGGLPSVFGGGHNNGIARAAITESTMFAVCVLVGWVVIWTALGAWRMVTRDA